MDKKDLNQIGILIDQKLKPIAKKIDTHGNQFKTIAKKLENHDKQFKSIRTKLGEHSQKLDSLTLDMIDVQKKTDAIADIHDLVRGTREKVDDHELRIETLESAA